jgi:DNA-directed RNA polymerase specialized sigma24 family protein
MNDVELQDVWAELPYAERMAKRMRIDPSLVNELALKTLMDARRTWVDDGRRFHSYAMVALRKQFRAWKHSQPVTEEAHPNIVRQSDDSAQLELGWEARLAAIRRRMTECEFELLRAHYVDGWSMEELAKREGCTRGTIWNRIRKILDKVRA